MTPDPRQQYWTMAISKIPKPAVISHATAANANEPIIKLMEATGLNKYLMRSRSLDDSSKWSYCEMALGGEKNAAIIKAVDTVIRQLKSNGGNAPLNKENESKENLAGVITNSCEISPASSYSGTPRERRYLVAADDKGSVNYMNRDKFSEQLLKDITSFYQAAKAHVAEHGVAKAARSH